MQPVRALMWIFATSVLLTGSAIAAQFQTVALAGRIPEQALVSSEVARAMHNEKSLNMRLRDIRIEEKPFDDVIGWVGDITGAEISVDWESLDAAGIDRKTPVSVDLRDVRTSELLSDILADAAEEKLTYMLVDGVVIVSTRWPTFTEEASILAVSREALNGPVEKELPLAQAINVLTSYRKVTSDQYHAYAHQIGARGSVTLKGGEKFQWEIEPEYAAKVTAPGGEIVYLLHPRLKVEAARKDVQP